MNINEIIYLWILIVSISLGKVFVTAVPNSSRNITCIFIASIIYIGKYLIAFWFWLTQGAHSFSNCKLCNWMKWLGSPSPATLQGLSSQPQTQVWLPTAHLQVSCCTKLNLFLSFPNDFQVSLLTSTSYTMQIFPCLLGIPNPLISPFPVTHEPPKLHKIRGGDYP